MGTLADPDKALTIATCRDAVMWGIPSRGKGIHSVVRPWLARYFRKPYLQRSLGLIGFTEA